MYPLTGQIIRPSDDDRASHGLSILLSNAEDAQLFNISIGNSAQAIPDLLCHKLRDTLKAGHYPGDAEDLASGKLMINTPLTLEQAEQQWADMGLRPDSSDYEVRDAMSRYQTEQMASASKAELSANATQRDTEVDALTAKVAALTALVESLAEAKTTQAPMTITPPEPKLDPPAIVTVEPTTPAKPTTTKGRDRVPMAL